MLLFKLEYAPKPADEINYQIPENTLQNSLEIRDTWAQREMDQTWYRRFKRKPLASQRKDPQPQTSAPNQNGAT